MILVIGTVTPNLLFIHQLCLIVSYFINEKTLGMAEVFVDVRASLEATAINIINLLLRGQDFRNPSSPAPPEEGRRPRPIKVGEKSPLPLVGERVEGEGS